MCSGLENINPSNHDPLKGLKNTFLATVTHIIIMEDFMYATISIMSFQCMLYQLNRYFYFTIMANFKNIWLRIKQIILLIFILMLTIAGNVGYTFI